MSKQVSIGGKRRILTAEEEAKWFPQIPLADVKSEALARIESEVLDATQSFSYDGRTFALTPRNVANWYGLMLVDIIGSAAYPVDVTTADQDTYTLASKQAFRAWFGAGFSTVFAAEDAGRKRKKRVLDATTTDELEGI